MSKKISDLDAVTSLDGTELIEVVQGGVSKRATVSQVLPYKVYTALLSQSGSDVPTDTVLEDTTGNIDSIVRYSEGRYEILFTTAVLISKIYMPNSSMTWEGGSNTITIPVTDEGGALTGYITLYGTVDGLTITGINISCVNGAGDAAELGTLTDLLPIEIRIYS